MANALPKTSVIDFVEDLFSEEKIKGGQNPIGPLMDERDKAILRQEVPVDFVQAIAEGKTPEIKLPEPKPKVKAKEEPEEVNEVKTIQDCVREFRLIMAQAKGLLDEMTTCGMLGVNMGPPPKDPAKKKVKKKRNTKDLVEEILRGR